MKLLASLVIISSLALSTAQAQQSTSDLRLKQVREAFEEKLKVDLHTLQSKARQSKSSAPAPAEAAGSVGITEKAVSTTTVPEAEVHAAINPIDTMNIVVSPMQNTSSLIMPIYYSKDFGKTWKKSVFRPWPYDPSAVVVGGGDPLFAYDADGKLYMSWIHLFANTTFDTICAGMYWAWSNDGGQTWSRTSNGYIGTTKAPFSLQTGPDPSFELDDKEWLTVDRSSSPFRGTLYAAWTHIAHSGYGVYVRRKLPTADSMEAPVLVSHGNYQTLQYTSIGIDKNGGVHVSFTGSIDGQNFSLYHAYSTDGGKTFRNEEKISNVDIPGQSADAASERIFGLRDPGNYPCPHIAIDTAMTGNMFCVWNGLGIDENDGHGTDIYFAACDAATSKWGKPIVLNNDKNTDIIDHFYPSIAVNQNGVITVTWYDRREDPDANTLARLYMAQSFDHGQTWTNIPVASKPTDFATVGNVNGGFGIGEYNQVLMTSGYAIPVWSDGRKGTGDLDIYAAFIPVSPNLSVPTRTERVTSNVRVFPSPASSKLNAAFDVTEASSGTVTIVNQLGQVISTIASGQFAIGEHAYELPVLALANGTYYLVIRTSSGIEEAPFVVKH